MLFFSTQTPTGYPYKYYWTWNNKNIDKVALVTFSLYKYLNLFGNMLSFRKKITFIKIYFYELYFYVPFDPEWVPKLIKK